MEKLCDQTEDRFVDEQKYVDHHVQSNSLVRLGTECKDSNSPAAYLME